MKILVVSDTHGNVKRLEKIYEKHEDEIDMLIHLGDGCDDVLELDVDNSIVEVVVVRGNNDFFSYAPEVVTKELNNVLVVAEHRPDYSYMDYDAGKYKRLLYMHGHKHIVKLEKDRNVMILSPGALFRPRDDNGYAYAIVEIHDDGKVSIKVRDMDGKILAGYKS